MKEIIKKILSIIIAFSCLLLIGCESDNLDNDDDNIQSSDMNGINRYVIMNDGKEEEYKIFYYGIDNAMIKLGDNNYDFEGAIVSGNLTLDEIFKDMEIKAQMNDGGTIIYKDGGTKKYFINSHVIIRCHTIDGNRDIYIGNNNMEYESHMCKNKVTLGEIKLEEQLELLNDIKKIVLRNKSNSKIKKTITNISDIEQMIVIMSKSTENTFPVNSNGTDSIVQFYSSDNKLVTEIYVWGDGNFGFDYNKEYSFNGGFSKFKEIFEWE